MRFVRRVNERGVLTLPAEVRAALDVDDGDIIEFELLRIVRKGGGAKLMAIATLEPAP